MTGARQPSQRASRRISRKWRIKWRHMRRARRAESQRFAREIIMAATKQRSAWQRHGMAAKHGSISSGSERRREIMAHEMGDNGDNVGAYVAEEGLNMVTDIVMIS